MIKIVSLLTEAASGAAPQGATGQVAASPMGADGKPVLSGQVQRNDAFSNGGKSNSGLLPIQFRRRQTARSSPARGGTDRRQQLSVHDRNHHAITPLFP